MSDSPAASPGSGGIEGDHGAARRAIWYRRRPVLVAVLVLAVLGVTVVTDIPGHASRAAQISSDSSVVNQVNADVGACSYAVGEVFTIYRAETSGRLSASDAARVPSLLRDDQAACSFTDQSIFDLSNIEVPGSAAGRHLQDLVSTVTLWATSEGLAAIEAVQTLHARPADQRALRQLAAARLALATDRSLALSEIAAADRVLGTHLPRLKLAVPVPA